MDDIEQRRESELANLEEWLERPMQILGLIWLALLVLELTIGLEAWQQTVVTVIWVLFIGDVLLRVWLAPDTWGYLRRNWLTIVSLAVPALRFLRFVRVLGLARYVRVVRASRGLRLLRVVSSINRGMRSVRGILQRRAFGYVAAATAMVAVVGAAGMQALEAGPGFDSFGSALWWTAMILTGIGSEAWPDSAEGRALAFLLSLYGLAMFGYITSVLTSFFLERDAAARGEPGGV